MNQTPHGIFAVGVFLFSFSPYVFSAPTLEWATIEKGPGIAWDEPAATLIDTNGFVYITGQIGAQENGSPNGEIYTVKYSPSGTKLWSAVFSGRSQLTESGQVIRVDATGNVYVAGSIYNLNERGSDFFLIKYDRNGNLIWSRAYNGRGSDDDSIETQGMEIDPVSGDIVVSGSCWGSLGLDLTEFDFCTVKYDKDGNELWSARYDSGDIGNPASGWDKVGQLALDASGNIYVVGYSSLAGLGRDDDVVIIKYGPKGGTPLWHGEYGHIGDDRTHGLLIESTGNSYVLAETKGTDGKSNFTLLKFNTNGVLLWERHYSSEAGADDMPVDMKFDPQGNILVTGHTMVLLLGNNMDIVTVKYSPSGNVLWSRRYSSPDGGTDVANRLSVDGAGNAYVVGSTTPPGQDSSFLTLRYQPNGDLSWASTYSGPTGYRNSYGTAITVTPDGSSLIVTGRSTSSVSEVDILTAKFSSLTGTSENTSSIPANYALQQNFPNPFNPSTSIRYQTKESGFVKLSVFNEAGKEVKVLVNGIQPSGEHEVRFSGDGLPSGVYFYRIEAGSFVETKKMVLLK